MISRNEKADVPWLAFKDEFPGINHDQFRRVLLRCKKSHATKGKALVGRGLLHQKLKTGVHVATEIDNEDEESLDCKPSAIDTPNRCTRLAEEAELEFGGDSLCCNLPALIAPHDHTMTQE